MDGGDLTAAGVIASGSGRGERRGRAEERAGIHCSDDHFCAEEEKQGEVSEVQETVRVR